VISVASAPIGTRLQAPSTDYSVALAEVVNLRLLPTGPEILCTGLSAEQDAQLDQIIDQAFAQVDLYIRPDGAIVEVDLEARRMRVLDESDLVSRVGALIQEHFPWPGWQ